MAINLSRNSKVLFTTNVDPNTGKLKDRGYSPNNTFELQVLDGFSFSQNTNAEAVSVTEAGATPTRGTRSFNTSLAPVDFSFSTYLRPNTLNGKKVAEEGHLWNALLGSKPVYADGYSVSLTTTSVTYTNGTSTIALGGTGFPTIWTTGVNITAGDYVMISGLTVTTGSDVSYFNSLATVTGTPSSTALNLVLVNNAPAATTLTAAVTVSIVKVNAPTINSLVTYGTGGTGTITSATYAYDSTKNQATITFAGTSLSSIALSTSAFYVLTGVTVPSTGATTADIFNASVYLAAAGDQTATSLKLTYVVPPTATATTWASFTGPINIGISSWVNDAASTNTYVSTAATNQNTLLKFGMIYIIDQVAYAVDNCALSQVTVDFGLDQITTAQWTGQGTALRKIGDAVTTTTQAAIFTNSVVPGFFVHSSAPVGPLVYGSYAAKMTGSYSASYLTNKLTNLTLTNVNAIKDGNGNTKIAANTAHNIAVTGGNFSINNNVTYSTPANIGVVNVPQFYYLGTRAITGNFTAYLRTGGSPDAGSLLQNILDSITANPEMMFAAVMKINGNTAPFAQLEFNSMFIQVPAIDVQQVVSINIPFTAEGRSATASINNFDIQQTNDMVLRYYP